MAQQIINVGTAPNDGTGDTLKTSFTKANANFTELYSLSGGLVVPPQGRLTLQTATPVMTSTQAGKIIIYYTPYVGNQMPIVVAGIMTMTTFAELSVAIADTIKNPAAIGASKINDWFVWSDAGTLRLSHGPDWTNDTTRAMVLGLSGGIWVNGAAITNGPASGSGTYVGTTRSNASSTLDWKFGSLAAGGGKAFFNVWNAYNRCNLGTTVQDTTGSYAYNSLPFVPYLNSVNNSVDFVCGLSEDSFFARATSYATCDGSGAIGIGIGLDVTNAISGVPGVSGVAAGNEISGECAAIPAIGKHTVTALQKGNNGTGCTFFGGATNSGLSFMFRA